MRDGFERREKGTTEVDLNGWSADDRELTGGSTLINFYFVVLGKKNPLTVYNGLLLSNKHCNRPRKNV